MTASVTYTGEEVALLAGALASALPALDDADFEVADLLLDRALAALPRPLAPDLEARVAQLRATPADRFMARLRGSIPVGVTFTLIDATVVGRVRAGRALELLEQLVARRVGLTRAFPLPTTPATERWVIEQ